MDRSGERGDLARSPNRAIWKKGICSPTSRGNNARTPATEVQTVRAVFRFSLKTSQFPGTQPICPRASFSCRVTLRSVYKEKGHVLLNKRGLPNNKPKCNYPYHMSCHLICDFVLIGFYWSTICSCQDIFNTYINKQYLGREGKNLFQKDQLM